MLKSRRISTNTFVQCAFHDGRKRFLRTVPTSSKRSPAADFGRLNQQIPADLPNTELAGRSWARHLLSLPLVTPPQRHSQQDQPLTLASSRWDKHSLNSPASAPLSSQTGSLGSRFPGEISVLAPARRSRISRYKNAKSLNLESKLETTLQPNHLLADSVTPLNDATTHKPTSIVEPFQLTEPLKGGLEPTTQEMTSTTATPVEETTTATTVKAKKPRRQLKPRKALIALTPNAVENLRGLLDQPEPQLIRIGVKNRGCSGLTYHLEYVSEPGKFDETVEQDGVKVVIDSKALFSIVGSQMDWIDDKLSSRFIFRNPNSKGTCGCGESFMV